jgi:hypothetical protein
MFLPGRILNLFYLCAGKTDSKKEGHQVFFLTR